MRGISPYGEIKSQSAPMETRSQVRRKESVGKMQDIKLIMAASDFPRAIFIPNHIIEVGNRSHKERSEVCRV